MVTRRDTTAFVAAPLAASKAIKLDNGGNSFYQKQPWVCPSQRSARQARKCIWVAKQEATSAESSSHKQHHPPIKVAAIVLAGGVGSRMKADRPKQFLELDGETVVQRSLDIFLNMQEVTQVILVVESKFRDQFSHLQHRVTFANPGKERQDSVYSGFQAVHQDQCDLVSVHDAARPLVTPENIRQVFADAYEHGAAVLGVPSKATIKESADGKFVLRTIERSRLWEIQTPQVIRPVLLKEGFDKVYKEKLAVTDDVSIVEALGKPVKITMGEYTNIKLTTPEDMIIARSILDDRKKVATMI